eukprot:3279136-Amphidinium_carterae.1
MNRDSFNNLDDLLFDREERLKSTTTSFSMPVSVPLMQELMTNLDSMPMQSEVNLNDTDSSWAR